MRYALLLSLVACASFASADRLISTPTGRKLPYRTVRIETIGELGHTRTGEYSVGMGIGTSFDMEIRSEKLTEPEWHQTFDLGYNIIAPVPGLSPGVSLGVQDALNRTYDGRRFYLAVTYRPTFFTIDGDYPADVTLGGYFGGFQSAFVGVRLPFSKAFRLLVEHNGIRITSGIEIAPTGSVGLRMLFRDRDVLGSLVVSHHF